MVLGALKRANIPVVASEVQVRVSTDGNTCIDLSGSVAVRVGARGGSRGSGSPPAYKFTADRPIKAVGQLNSQLNITAMLF